MSQRASPKSKRVSSSPACLQIQSVAIKARSKQESMSEKGIWTLFRPFSLLFRAVFWLSLGGRCATKDPVCIVFHNCSAAQSREKYSLVLSLSFSFLFRFFDFLFYLFIFTSPTPVSGQTLTDLDTSQFTPHTLYTTPLFSARRKASFGGKN
ncbi:hypothetical protein GALMADRAFT_558186 [Galerina marginata CBS 339.88]|uniref:Transmembrane protein n=1 Tax=Galerina marginata (strain CBS 339.88) TaxID=685588 RepID=A0A067SX62_GALM3|nr:hypothetical protein GALMADRAFT_558186 [Galerina marginata CBS 339.88]